MKSRSIAVPTSWPAIASPALASWRRTTARPAFPAGSPASSTPTATSFSTRSAENPMTIDKVTLQVLANHCRAAAENMAYTLYRTAHSTFVKETEDFTIALTDAVGRTVAVPKDLGATWYPG